MHLFEPFTQRGLTLRNRVALSPMCMYSCENLDGRANSWHLVHLGTRASGGCGLVMTEATAVMPNGRISPQDLGLWEDGQIEPLIPVTDFIRSQGAASAIQLAHAGRKAGTYRPWSPVRGFAKVEDGGWRDQVAPSALPFREDLAHPREMSLEEILAMQAAFREAARRADAAGFDVVEIHAAHGYLQHQFLSPISNRRTDAYGGDFQGRTRMLRETTRAVREVWPERKPLWVRISATDWVEGGWTADETVELARHLREDGVDLMDCSSGGSTLTAEIPSGPGYQVQFAERVRRESGMATGAVGQITEAAQANAIVAEGRADVVFLGRELLRNPYWPQVAARELGVAGSWPAQYQWAVG